MKKPQRLGLSIGLHAVERLATLARGEALPAEARRAIRPQLAGLQELAPLAGRIEAFWLRPEHQESSSWIAHLDIDAVMLATSLLPDGYLTV